MKRRPIIFSGEMVREILDGPKTQTRRVVTPQPAEPKRLAGHSDAIHAVRCQVYWGRIISECPYGKVGDRLWVKQTHRLTRYRDGGRLWVKCERRLGPTDAPEVSCFRWNDIPQPQRRRLSRIKTWGKWRSPRFMYRFLARIELEITNVRVQRVQEITQDDAADEGCLIAAQRAARYPAPRVAFRGFWDFVNAKRGFGWDVNPFVRAISFRKV